MSSKRAAAMVAAAQAQVPHGGGGGGGDAGGNVGGAGGGGAGVPAADAALLDLGTKKGVQYLRLVRARRKTWAAANAAHEAALEAAGVLGDGAAGADEEEDKAVVAAPDAVAAKEAAKAAADAVFKAALPEPLSKAQLGEISTILKKHLPEIKRLEDVDGVVPGGWKAEKSWGEMYEKLCVVTWARGLVAAHATVVGGSGATVRASRSVESVNQAALKMANKSKLGSKEQGTAFLQARGLQSWEKSGQASKTGLAVATMVVKWLDGTDETRAAMPKYVKVWRKDDTSLDPLRWGIEKIKEVLVERCISRKPEGHMKYAKSAEMRQHLALRLRETPSNAQARWKETTSEEGRRTRAAGGGGAGGKNTPASSNAAEQRGDQDERREQHAGYLGAPRKAGRPAGSGAGSAQDKEVALRWHRLGTGGRIKAFEEASLQLGEAGETVGAAPCNRGARRVLTVIETAGVAGEKPMYHTTMYVAPNTSTGAATGAGAGAGAGGGGGGGGGVDENIAAVVSMLKGVGVAVVSPAKENKRKRIAAAACSEDVERRHTVVARKALDPVNPMAGGGPGG